MIANGTHILDLDALQSRSRKYVRILMRVYCSIGCTFSLQAKTLHFEYLREILSLLRCMRTGTGIRSSSPSMHNDSLLEVQDIRDLVLNRGVFKDAHGPTPTGLHPVLTHTCSHGPSSLYSIASSMAYRSNEHIIIR